MVRWQDEITRLVGVNPVELNSKYWGAQNRARLFWTNIPGAKNVEMMQGQNDRKIYLKDILVDGTVDCDKSRALTARYEGVTETPQQLSRYLNGKPGQIVFAEMPKRLGNINPSGKGMNGNVFSTFAKSPTLTTNKGEGLKIAVPHDEYDALFINSEKQIKMLKTDTPSDETQRVAEFDGGSQGCRVYGREGKGPSLMGNSGGMGGKTGLIFACLTPDRYSQEIGIRKLHPVECERLMNLPGGYTEGVSNNQRYKMLGNGWDVDVVADLLRGLVETVVEIQPDLFKESLI